MSAGDFVLQRWLNHEFLGRHDRPVRPDGRPLHAYRCCEAELDTLQQRLRNALRSPDPAKGKFLAAGFCLFAAEWWRCHYGGGHWGWEPIFEELGRTYDFQTAKRLTESGLRFWKRPLRRLTGRRQFLASLVLEGGFPLRIIERDQGRLRHYLVRVLDELDRAGGDRGVAASIAEGAGAMLPKRLRFPEFYELVSELAAAVIERRHLLPRSLDGADPVALLDAKDPGWRSAMPLAVEDESARRLIRAVLRESVTLLNRTRLLSRLCYRMLTRSGDRWRSRLGFTMSGEILSAHWPNIPEGAQRARLIATGALAEQIGAPLALLRVRPELDRCSIEPLSGSSHQIDFPLSLEAEASLLVNNHHSPAVPLPGGEARREAVLVFEDADDPADSDPEAPPNELRLLAAGSVRSRRNRLFVLVRGSGTSRQVAPGGCIREIGVTEQGDRTLLEIRGHATFIPEEGDLPIRVSTSMDTGSTLVLQAWGPRPRWRVLGCDAFLGFPRFKVIRGDDPPTDVNRRNLHWRPWGDRAWRTLDATPMPFGGHDVALVEDGALAHRLRLAVLPPTMSIELLPKGPTEGIIRVQGIAGALVTVDCRSPQREDRPYKISAVSNGLGDDAAELRLRCDGLPPPAIRLNLAWQVGQPVALELPYPAKGAGFVDARNQWLPRTALLTLDQLYGVRAQALGRGNRSLLHAALSARDATTPQPFIWRQFGEEIGLSALGGAFRRLFAASRDVDAEIRADVDHETQIRIRRFDLEIEFDERCEVVTLSEAAIAQVRADGWPPIELAARGLSGISDEEVILESIPGDTPRWCLSRTTSLRGPRLLYGRVGGRYRIRPRILPALDKTPHDIDASAPLADIMRITDRSARIEAMRARLTELARRFDDADWREIETAREFLQGRLPLATLDVFNVLIDIPEASLGLLAISPTTEEIERVLSMEDELPFMWIILPLRSWIEVFSRYHTHLFDILTKNGLDEHQGRDLAKEQIERVLQRIYEAEPVLAGQVAAVREHLSLKPQADVPSLTTVGTPEVQRALQEQLSCIRQECLQRNSDAHWPPDYPFREKLVGFMPPLPAVEGTRYRTATLDAPFAAARVAAEGLSIEPAMVERIREFRDFDTLYFDDTYRFALVLNLSEQQFSL